MGKRFLHFFYGYDSSYRNSSLRKGSIKGSIESNTSKECGSSAGLPYMWNIFQVFLQAFCGLKIFYRIKYFLQVFCWPYIRLLRKSNIFKIFTGLLWLVYRPSTDWRSYIGHLLNACCFLRIKTERRFCKSVLLVENFVFYGWRTFEMTSTDKIWSKGLLWTEDLYSSFTDRRLQAGLLRIEDMLQVIFG